MDNTRQYSPTIDGIRPDHVARYQFAASVIPKGKYVLDMACGCGYGSWIMEHAGLKVTGVDIEPEAIEYAQRHYQGPTYFCQRAEDTKGHWDWLVTYETVEHVHAPSEVFAGVNAPNLIVSVPNQDYYPFFKERFAEDKYPHLRHYTPEELNALLNAMGYAVKDWYCQPDKRGEIKRGTEGMFLIAVAKII